MDLENFDAHPDDDALEPLPEFTSADIVKLYAATFLPLCEVAVDAGLTSHARIAQMISSHVPYTENGAWAQLARALVGVLERAPVKTQTDGLSQAEAEAEARRTVAPQISAQLVVFPGGRL